MTTPAWTPLLVAVIGLLGILVQQWRQRPVLRDQVKSDLEIWNALPGDSSVREDLLADIDYRVRRLLKDESELRRDPSGMTLGVLMVVLFAWLSWWVWTLGGSYRFLELATIPLLIFGAFGFVESALKASRDERGRRQRRRN